jgi:hypothetical protein
VSKRPRDQYMCAQIKLEIASFSIIVKHYIASCAHGHTSKAYTVYMPRELTTRREVRRREALASDAAAVAAVAAFLSLRCHHRRHSRRRHHLHPARLHFPAFPPSAMPSAVHRCRPSLPPTPRPSPPPASAACIGHRNRRYPCRQREAARDRERARSRLRL